jgi:uncharacterized NAD-dependent epimerase/dehydratase family protein
MMSRRGEIAGGDPRHPSFGLDMLPRPYLLFLGDETHEAYAKTAFGLRDWARDSCVGEYALEGATVTTGLPKLTPREAWQRGARSLVIGVANIGGQLTPTWIPALTNALEAGLDLISGMHGSLWDNPVLAAAANTHGRRLFDVRKPPRGIPVATGRRRPGRRVLTVGTDCALGKKYTALAIARELRARGLDAEFRATGQTGILISGGGIPIDAVVADFVAGAAEMLSPDASPDHWDIVEGQGSLFHPAYAGVSLGLLHGTQPDVIVACHDPSRARLGGLDEFALPTLAEVIEQNIVMGRRTNPSIRCAGISLNTSRLGEDEARDCLAQHKARWSLPCADPMRQGPEWVELIDAVLHGAVRHETVRHER